MLQLKLCLPPNIIAFHVKGHQDTRKKWEHLTIPERLNIQADKLIGSKARAPLNQHILQTSLAIYVNGNYIPNNYVHSIRSACEEKDARDFLIQKNTTRTILQSRISNGNFTPNISKGKRILERKRWWSSFIGGWRLETRILDRSLCLIIANNRKIRAWIMITF